MSKSQKLGSSQILDLNGKGYIFRLKFFFLIQVFYKAHD